MSTFSLNVASVSIFLCFQVLKRTFFAQDEGLGVIMQQEGNENVLSGFFLYSQSAFITHSQQMDLFIEPLHRLCLEGVARWKKQSEGHTHTHISFHVLFAGCWVFFTF